MLVQKSLFSFIVIFIDIVSTSGVARISHNGGFGGESPSSWDLGAKRWAMFAIFQ